MTKEELTEYWYCHYEDKHCTLCGNRGVVNTIGVRTPAGVLVGRLNYCICPNGQVMRECGADMNKAVNQ